MEALQSQIEDLEADSFICIPEPDPDPHPEAKLSKVNGDNIDLCAQLNQAQVRMEALQDELERRRRLESEGVPASEVERLKREFQAPFLFWVISGTLAKSLTLILTLAPW